MDLVRLCVDRNSTVDDILERLPYEDTDSLRLTCIALIADDDKCF